MAPDFERLVALACLAPSAHNTQPVRWRQDGDHLELFADLSRRLPVSDPDDRDLKISCGAAVEGTVLALAAAGKGAKVVWLDAPSDGNLLPFAKVIPTGDPNPADAILAGYVPKRVTFRGGFTPPPDEVWQDWDCDAITLVRKADDVSFLARQVDLASASLLRDRALRQELLHWMRLRKGQPGFDSDGLNADALSMDAFSRRFVKPVLGTRLYDVLYRLGLGPTLSGEQQRTAQAGAIALFHWPRDGSVYEAGRAFYRYWLQAAGRGLAGWPAAALADDQDTTALIAARFGLPKDRVLLNALRLGQARGPLSARTRLGLPELII